MFGDTVFFGTMRAKVGEPTEGLTVTAINAPYSITVEHMRGTYTVPLFGKGDDRFLQPTKATSGASGVKVSAGSAAPAPGGDAAKPDAMGRVGAPGAPTAPGAAGGPGAVSGPGAAGGKPGSLPNGVPPGSSGPRPGTVVPSEAPASDVPSPAMEPQEVPPPGDPSGQPSGGEPSSDGAGVDYVDRDQLPPPRSAEQIAAMTIPQAKSALAAIEATAGWQVDSHNRARLNHERDLLLQRINENP